MFYVTAVGSIMSELALRIDPFPVPWSDEVPWPTWTLVAPSAV